MSILLAACQSAPKNVSMSELETVPDGVDKAIDLESSLQLINKGEMTSYIVYQPKGPVTADLEEEGDTVNINFTNEKGDNIIRHVYELTMDEKHDTLEVLVNGKPVSFDVVTDM